MGIAKGAAKLLLVESLRRPFGGRALMLGKQDVYFSHQTLRQMAKEFHVELCDPGSIDLSHKPDFAASGYITDECLFKLLGFSECATLDYSDYESAQYIFDLNNPEVPQDLCGAFDLIVDAGTIEHVFHLPNVFNNIFKMLKEGGRIIHLSPSSNYMDHGFYMFSPTLFWDFYETNRFEINTCQVIRHTVNAHTEPWEISNYRPGSLDQISFGGLDDGMYGILCIATKTKDATGDVIPQQRVFAGLWASGTPEGSLAVNDPPPPNGDELLDQLPSNNGAAARPASKSRAVKEVIRTSPLLYKTLRLPFVMGRAIKRKVARNQGARTSKKGLGLKVVARY